MRRVYLFLFIASLWSALDGQLFALEAAKPNVVLIYCDDLGYGDVGCFGATKHRTPNIDQLSTDGLTLTNFYVTSGVCSPSRSSLMTGCYPIRVGLEQNESGAWVLFPGNQRGLNPQETTIAEVLKKADYATKIVGKWHLGDQPEFLPTKQGFDQYFGIPYSNDMGHWNKRRNYPPLPLLRDETVIESETDQSQLTGRYTEEAIKFIEANQNQPFFLYMPHTFPHVPLYASDDFRGKSANGPFGDAVEEIDWSVGQIVAALDRLKLSKNTLVIFSSDNGAAAKPGGSNAPLRGFKGSTWEGGMRVPCIMKWPAGIPAGTVSHEIVSTLDMLPTLAKLAGEPLDSDVTIDGVDVSTLLHHPQDTQSPRSTMYYYFRDRLCAVRQGKWKLHVRSSSRNEPKDWQPLLYNLGNDISESRSVYDENPQVVAELEKLIDSCKTELGDGSQKGTTVRKPGHVKNAKPLTQNPQE